MSKKDALQKGKNAGLLDHATVRHGLKLSDVRYEVTTKIKRNPQNSVFFREETAQYFERLREDVQARGIIVPLIAKLDGTLLAGHNRLQVAEELGLKEIPVQYLLEELSADDEKSFVIKDNLLRRQFTYDQWTAIFRELIPNYDERLFEEARGRKSGASTTKKGASKNTTSQNGQVSEFPKAYSLTQEIAERTSLNERTVRRINEAARTKVKALPKHNSSKTKTSSTQSKAKITVSVDAVSEVKTYLQQTEKLLQEITPSKRKSLVKILRRIVEKYDDV